MKILVIDDKQENLQAARDQLGAEHELTTTGGYDSGLRLITQANVEPFDVVLCDLFMPAPRQVGYVGLSPEGAKHTGEEMPIGIFLVLKAAKHGVKFVAVLTMTNHHDHPASAMIDGFDFPMTLGGAKMILSNYYEHQMQDASGVWQKNLAKL